MCICLGRVMQSLFNSIVMPEFYRPVRVPTYPMVDRTSVVELKAPLAYQQPAASSKIMVARQASLPLWTTFLSSNVHYQATWSSSGDDTGGRIGLVAAPKLKSVHNGANSVASISRFVCATTSPYTATYPPVATDSVEQTDYIYIPPGFRFCVAFSYGNVSSVVTDGTVTVISSNGTTSNLAFNGGTIGDSSCVTPFIITGDADSSWWRPVAVSVTGVNFSTVTDPVLTFFVTNATAPTFVKSVTANTIGSVTLGGGVASAMMPLYTPPEAITAPFVFDDTRVSAVAIRVINATKIMNKEGSALGARVPPSLDPFSITRDSLALLPESEKTTIDVVSGNGFYTHLAPGPDYSDYKHYITKTNDPIAVEPPIQIPAYDLTSTAHAHVIFIADADQATPNSWEITVGVHLEFRAITQLFPTSLTTASLETYHRAVLMQAQKGYFISTADPGAIKRAFASKMGARGQRRKPMPPRSLTLPKPPIVGQRDKTKKPPPKKVPKVKDTPSSGGPNLYGRGRGNRP